MYAAAGTNERAIIFYLNLIHVICLIIWLDEESLSKYKYQPKHASNKFLQVNVYKGTVCVKTCLRWNIYI